MKCKLKPDNKQQKNKKDTNIFSWCLGKIVSDIKKANPIPDKIGNRTKRGSCFLVISIPSLFMKILFWIKCVLLKRISKRGIQIKVLQSIKVANCGMFRFSRKKLPVASPLEIPSQNTRFHNLSLLNNILGICLFCSSKVLLALSLLVATCFVKSCIIVFSYNIKVHAYIVPKICRLFKQIIIIFGVIISLWVNTSHAATRPEILRLISVTEKEYNIPSGLLLAIAKIESNLESYALNINGRSMLFQDKDTALKTIHQSLEAGITNIDIGVAQVNYKWHRHNFSKLEDMLSPKSNIEYAAKLLSKLKQQYGDWHTAIRRYHSASPYHYRKYSRKIVLCWLNSNKLTN